MAFKWSLVVGSLSDWRLQVFALTSATQNYASDARLTGAVQSKWKLTTDPGSGWSDWTDMPMIGSEMFPVASALYPAGFGLLQLWVIFGQDDSLHSIMKSSDDSGAAWGTLDIFDPAPPGLIFSFAASQLFGLPPRSEFARIQLWAINDNRLFTSLSKFNANPSDPSSFYLDWSEFSPPPPQPVQSIWALFEDGSTIWVVGTDDKTYSLSGWGPTGPDSDSVEWGTWSEFLALPNGNKVINLAAANLLDGRTQVFASDANGTLWSIWQVSKTQWLDAWQSFSMPGGNNVLNFGGNALALGTLPDGTLQLFAIDDGAGAWTTWKASSDPNAGWLPWVQF